MEGYLLPAVAVFFSSLLCFVFFMKKRIKLFENSIYGVMLVSILLDSFLVSFIQYITCKNGMDTSLLLVNIVNKIDFLCLIIFTNCLFLYTLLITFPGLKDKIKIIINISLVIDFIFYFLILLSNMSLITDGYHYSVNGSSTLVTYIICGFYLLMSIIITLVNFKNISRRHIPIGAIIVMILFLFVIFRINPYLIVISIVLTFINYIMYFTLQNPDVKMVQQLEMAREHADKANNAKTEFLSSMSHEIRTPLNAISGFSNCIIDAKSLDEAKENAKDIVDASDTLLDIVNGILDISKIESGRFEIVNSPYDAPATFKELAKLITPKMKEKGLFFTYYIAPDLPKALCGDPANIKKIVTNLLSNACKYTKSGFVKYEVNCVNMNDYCRLVISVEDSGQGIKKENINKLFTRFQRLEEDKNITIEGTGLGLAITKQLTEMMGGKVIVHSVYGTGSKFTIVLNQKIDNENKVSEHKYKTTLDLHDVRILVVDDNVLNIKVAKKLLERHNANNIKTCESGFDCINRIGKGEIYDIILLDDMMPKMSGIETLQKLKSMPNFKTPVIALTANAITGMKEHYLAEGFDNYLAKPIQDDELIRSMNEVLGRVATEQMPIVSSSEVIDDGESKEPEIIPVEDNIEEELGDKLNISTKAVEINVSPFTVKNMSDSNVEMLDDDPISDDEINTDTNNIYDVEYLKSKSIDVDGALQSLGDMETYNLAISTYLEESNNIWKRIVSYKDSKNISDYATEVHALKSSSRYIGLTKLGDIAYQHELKSKANDVDYINDHFSELENEYNKTIEIVKNYVKYNII